MYSLFTLRCASAVQVVASKLTGERVQNKAFEVEANWFAVQEGTYEAVKAACVAGGGVLASINSLAEAEIAGKVCGKHYVCSTMYVVLGSARTSVV